MTQEVKITTREKAFQINLDHRRYGTFAEIGAGQEVARWFFRVGGAASTIAKSISAYDMAVSDAIYGRAKRYVSRERLQNMLDHEHSLNLERLRDTKENVTSFFAFADTVTARSYKGNNECHGWMGVKFQARPRDEDSQLILHVRMLDQENGLQQEALGIIGVNLLYACFYLSHDPEKMLESLLDNLTTHRIEVDMAVFSGIEFRQVDNRVASLKLVQLGLSGAAMFDPSGKVLQPAEILRKRPVLIERGSFRPVTRVNVDMLQSAHRRFAADLQCGEETIVELMELNMRNLLATGALDLDDFLARADLIAATGKIVLISDYFDYHRLASWIALFTTEPVALVMGVPSVRELFVEKLYSGLEGGILEGFGRLFTADLRIYVYPWLDPVSGKVHKVDTLDLQSPMQNLYRHVVEGGKIQQLDEYDESALPILSRDVLQRIKNKDASWTSMVPPEIAEIVKRRHFFGYRDGASED
ncbi:TonB-dependent receptor [Acidipila sp. EB88]|uniref:TonB-dependent receptor n=1 Tax=Acidipila sp. EB88 TaxID=2305226 RepID=UPI000F5D88AD|nr:TonB-dependent receptor [Acidipila sp. EB88]RRA47176.1 TonB-dependent receptor [Acidipila sp. EB88]